MFPGVTCVVPARLGSTRFFGKLLAPLLGKPVVVHALERAAEAGCFDRIVCLTDSAEIAEAVAGHGFACERTGDAANGTERIARALPALPGDLFVNLQGDEPAFPPEGLRALCAAIRANPEWSHALVHAEAPSLEELANPNRVKARLDADGFIAGFARAIDGPAANGAAGAFQYARRGGRPSAPAFANGIPYRLQMGAYAYSRAYLERYAALPPSAAELELSHEMLRAPASRPCAPTPRPRSAGARRSTRPTTSGPRCAPSKIY